MSVVMQSKIDFVLHQARTKLSFGVLLEDVCSTDELLNLASANC